MVVHLIVNSSVINGAATFQNNVLNIHKLGALLPLVEWTFIFIPILFHMIFGFVIIAGGMPNPHNYPYAANYRYTLQRATGMIADDLGVLTLARGAELYRFDGSTNPSLIESLAPLGVGEITGLAAVPGTDHLLVLDGQLRQLVEVAPTN